MKIKDYLYVITQVSLLSLLVLKYDFWLFQIPRWMYFMSVVIMVIGLLICILAILQLSSSLSPFPSPKNNAVLITEGLYHHIRHPIYTGLMILTFGTGLFRGSWFNLLITLVLWLLLYFKSKYEEKLMISTFSEYYDYMKKTGRFFPYF